MALSDDSLANCDMVSRLARRILLVNNQPKREKEPTGTTLDTSTSNMGNNHAYRRNLKYSVKGGGFLCSHAVFCMVNTPAKCTCSTLGTDSSEVSAGDMLEPECFSGIGDCTFVSGVSESNKSFHHREDISLVDGLNSDNGRSVVDEIKNMDGCSKDFSPEHLNLFDGVKCQGTNQESAYCETLLGEHPEMFLPGLVIHIIPEQRSLLPLWKSCGLWDKKENYRAFVANREHFKEIIVSPYMFLDHLPWRCHHAMQRVLEVEKDEGHINDDMLNGANAV